MTTVVVTLWLIGAVLANGFLIVGGLRRGEWIREPWTKEDRR